MQYVQSCEICHLTKGSTQKPAGLLTPLNVPVLPWTSIAMDFLYMEPVFVDYASLIPGFRNLHEDKPHMIQFHKLLVISDRLTDYTFLIPCISEITAKNVIHMFENMIKPTVGLPFVIISDQDTLFMSRAFQNWVSENGILYKVGSTYHPQTDGASERKNRSIIPIFAAKKLEHGMNWVNPAPSVQTEVNTRISVSRKSSPFKSVFGYNPKVGPSILPHPIPTYSEPAERHYNTAENLTKAKDQQTTQANKRRQPSHSYKAGDQVILSTENLPTQYRA